MPKSVVFSNRAYTSILVETIEKISTETGGVFLGYRKDDIWYVIESIDPGPNSIFKPNYFEYDQDYVNHLINKISRLYDVQLDLIGLWHRHPGSFDSFSGTDDVTNKKYAELHELGAISVLVNIDPRFRMTVYSVTSPLKYDKIDFIIGDEYIPEECLLLRNCTILQEKFITFSSEKTSLSSLKNDWITKKIEGENKVFPRKSSKVVKRNQICFREIISYFLQKKTPCDIKCSELRIVSADKEQAVLLILEKLENDLEFLAQLGVKCQLSTNPIGLVVLKDDSEQVMKKHSRFEIAFGEDNNEVLISFNENCYKYYSGMFKDAYLEFLTKEGT